MNSIPIENTTTKITPQKTLKPFVKWAGGKGQLVDEIKKNFPTGLGSTITKYAEPFVGGGAILFEILSNYSLKDIYISDINPELINTYSIVRDNSTALIDQLYSLQNDYIPLDTERRKIYYYEKRERFNDLKITIHRDANIEKAALFIFLNKTCFNGLYRVNRKGLFNVPMGAYKNPCILDSENLMNISNALQNVEIVHADFRESQSFIDNNTFVYFDPPYRPLNATSSFTSYVENSFDDQAQVELAKFVAQIDTVGAKFLVSNSDPKNTNKNDTFFDDLYQQYNIKRVQATRMINCVGKSRGKISELLISNYCRRTIMDRNFEQWLSTFRTSIADYSYYTDFPKIHKNIFDIKIELNILNSLIGSDEIEDTFKMLLTKYPDTLKCIPILLAVRAKEIHAIDADGEFSYSFRNLNYSIEQYCVFMRKTGLFDLLQNHIINNLVDYVTGVETGLDSNARKNRGGHLMENLVESYIRKCGLKKDESYFKEMYIHQIQDKWHVDLSAISNQGKMEKRFDFVVKTQNMIYVIETNFYGSGGSKLNETARSYKTLSNEIDTIDGVTFVWFTDGVGWNSARHNLEETFDIMEHIYSIDDMENGIMNTLFI